MSSEESIIGCVLGTALGDAVGLPCEGLSRERGRKLFPAIQGPNLFRNRGMVSDDTEHTCIVAQALVASAGDTEIFEREMAQRLRAWILCLPVGVGLATLKAGLKLCVGVSPGRSGVWSAGNGPAMRSALLGVCFGHDIDKLRALVRANTLLTHLDPKAEWGAFAVALAAHFAAAQSVFSPHEYSCALREQLGEAANEFLDLIDQIVASVDAGDDTQTFAAQIGCEKGVSGYTLHTVPVALHAAWSHPDDFRDAVLSVVRCGGDADSTAAITGAIVGARVGKTGLPVEWLQSICEWPRSLDWMENLARQLAQVMESSKTQKPISVSVFALVPRNMFFLVIVLMHAARRAFPPY